MKNIEKKTSRKRTKLKIFVTIIIVLFIVILIPIGGIYKYLKEYGYGAEELPQTLAVYLHLDEGFTVKKEDGVSIFIGRENLLFYSDLVEKYGYREIEQSGNDLFCEKSEGEEDTGFVIGATEDWCHWFRIYVINNDYKIEDFK